jgi:hypothetical protein
MLASNIELDQHIINLLNIVKMINELYEGYYKKKIALDN